MRPTLKDVAKRAGVNFTLISKYLNRNPQARMTAATRERIDRALRELDYRPSVSARTLRSGRSHTIGLVSGDLTNAYYAHFADRTLRELGARGYQLLIALPGDEENAPAIQSLLARDVDGLIVPGTATPVSDRPTVMFDTARNKGYSVGGLDLDESLSAAVSAMSGTVAGLFFGYSQWLSAFRRIARRLGTDHRTFRLPVARPARLQRIRALFAAERPDCVITNGWETLTMVLALLDEEFPAYKPRIWAHANCTGPFLRDHRLAGVIHSSTTEQVRAMCEVLIERIERPELPPEERRLPTRYVPAKTPEYDALIGKHFALT